MRRLRALMLIALCAGCTKTEIGPEFVQGNIRIATPVTWQKSKSAEASDGGTLFIPIRDARGKVFDVYIDHRLKSPTPGAIYLNAHPGKSNSVQVIDMQYFKRKMGPFEYY